MPVRRAELIDLPEIESLLANHYEGTRMREVVGTAIAREGNAYIAAVSGNPPEAVAAYGMIAGTLATAALYGVVPISSRVTELLSFAAHDLKKCGAEQIVAEFPDTEDFRPYRDILLESGYTPTGLVEDFYRDGIAMVILTRKLTA